MKAFISIILFSFFYSQVNINAQEVISSGGNYFKTENGSLSSTIGEPVTETFIGTGSILTQGFQQSRLTVTSIGDPILSDQVISVYPNPTDYQVKIVLENAGKEKPVYKLFDSGGKLLIENQFEASGTDVDLTGLSSASYILKIYGGKQEIGSFKIIKR